MNRFNPPRKVLGSNLTSSNSPNDPLELDSIKLLLELIGVSWESVSSVLLKLEKVCFSIFLSY